MNITFETNFNVGKAKYFLFYFAKTYEVPTVFAPNLLAFQTSAINVLINTALYLLNTLANTNKFQKAH